ncbi:MAG TPA: hypothetical protein VJ001_07825 [Rhodocyclaceae bacterium]|nr:hypothetical protein [Rhodocyclaceae bacterium]
MPDELYFGSDEKNDRREDPRYAGAGLSIRIAGIEAPVLDVSQNGIKFAAASGHTASLNDTIDFELISHRWLEMRKATGCGVVRVLTDESVALRFVNASSDILMCIQWHFP